MSEKVTIGNCELYLADSREVLPSLVDGDKGTTQTLNGQKITQHVAGGSVTLHRMR